MATSTSPTSRSPVPGLTLPRGVGRLVTDVGEAIELLGGAEELALDLETSGLSPWRDVIAVVGLFDPVTRVAAVLHIRGSLGTPLRQFLSRKGVTLVGHNVVGFDALFLAEAGVDVFGPTWYDTMIAEQCVLKTLRKDVSVSLKATAKRRLGVELKKEADHGSWMVDELGPEQYEYVLGDILYLVRLKEAHEKRTAEEPSQALAVRYEMGLAPAVIRMSLNGLPFSKVAYGHYVAYARAQADEAKSRLAEYVPPDVNLRSPKQLKDALAPLGWPPARSTAHDFLKSVAEDPDSPPRLREALGAILEYRGHDQRLKMYSDEWLGKYVVNGSLTDQARVHARFWQCGTDTGRFSSSEPNLQQVPKDSARRMFEAPPGWQIVSADYSQIEVRVAAFCAPDKELLKALEAEDVHSAVAASVFHVPVERVTRGQRQLAKAMTFTLLFGGGVERLYAYANLNGSDLTRPQAKEVVQAFFERFTGLAAMRSWAFDLAQRPYPVTLVLPTGLKRVLRPREDLAGTRILNTIIQGSAAAVLKAALREADDAGLTRWIGAVVHDEIVACVPGDEVESFKDELAGCMLEGARRCLLDTPVKVEVMSAQTWGGAVMTAENAAKGEQERRSPYLSSDGWGKTRGRRNERP